MPGHQKEWQCPVAGCQYKTPLSLYWAQYKRGHVLAWHLEQKEVLLARPPPKCPVRLEILPPSEEAAWRCPVPGCNIAIRASNLPNFRNEGDYYLLRKRHHATAHPALPISTIHVPKQRGGNDKASVIYRNQLAAQRVRDLQAGKAGEHQTVRFVLLPRGVPLHPKTEKNPTSSCCRAAWGGTGTGITVTYCADCGQLAHGIANLGQTRCSRENKANALARLEGRLRGFARTTHDQALKATAEAALVNLTRSSHGAGPE